MAAAVAGVGAPSFSIRMAVALNSAVPDFGSVASIVRRLVATSSWKWRVMKVRPGPERVVDPDRHLDLAAARDDAHALALVEAEPATSSGEMSSDSPRRSGER